jgi:outer membrane protein TolC
MRKRKRLSLGAAVGLAAATALGPSPGSTQTTSLNEALASAHRTNPDLDAQRAELRATDELVPQALAGYRPRVFLDGGIEGARGQVGRTRNSGTPLDGDQTANRTTAQIGLSVRQNLYAGGATAAEVERAENLVRAGRAQLIAT